MGMEHSQERLDARDQLIDLHERQPHRYPCEWVWDVREELWWRWVEELKEEFRRLFRLLSTEAPSREEIRWAALAPDASGQANLRLPTAFQLGEAEGYFQQVVEARVKRGFERHVWEAAWKTMDKPPPSAPTPTSAEGAPVVIPSRPTRTTSRPRSAGVGARPPRSEPRRPSPKRLP